MKTVGYTGFSNGRYYKVLNALGKTIPEAKSACKADGGRLASAPNGQENIRAMSRFQGETWMTGTVYFVDGTDVALERTWVLPDGTDIDEIK